MTLTLTACPHCSADVVPGDNFCESCGSTLAEPAAPVTPGDLTSAPAPTPGTCDCGGSFEDGYCSLCGKKAPQERDHQEETLSSPLLAVVSDKGHRHPRNEDAFAFAAKDSLALLVCDGVSSSIDPDKASAAATRAGADSLAASTDEDAPALFAALHAASDSLVEVSRGIPTDSAPACTIVAARIAADATAASLTWVGDSRAYWIPSSGTPRQLTRDDSWATERIAEGMDPAAAYAAHEAHAITRWLGVDAPALEERTVSLLPEVPGHLLLCSDGLWNYFEEPTALAQLLSSALASATGDTPEATLLAATRTLVQAALDAGGQDNVTVALVPLTPQDLA